MNFAPSAAPEDASGSDGPANQTSTISIPNVRAGTIGLFQVFDYQMTSAEATSSASRYKFVWGSGIGRTGATAYSWSAGNAGILNARYFVQPTDDYASSGHSVAWFQTYHPDWIVYDCDSYNRPTRTVAYQPGLPNDVPLDITNPAVIAYQIRTIGRFAITHGNNAIGADQTLFFDYDGGQHPGWFGCGIFRGGTFVRKWGATRGGFPNYDAKWKADVANWVRTARQYLFTDPAVAPYHLKFIVNHPAGNIADVSETTLLANVDAVLDETGFADYGHYTSAPGLFKHTLDYMRYAQTHGVWIFEVDKFSGSNTGSYDATALTPAQREWAIATFLMGNEGRALLYVTPGPYGKEYYFSEYATVNYAMGAACGPATALSNGFIYTRRFYGGMVVVNAGGHGTASVALPAHSYRDLEGRAVRNPLPVASADSYVLFTTNGCS